MSPAQRSLPAAAAGDVARRELYFFNLYRALQACIYAGLAYSPLAIEWVTLRYPLLGRLNALIYLVFALVAFLQTRLWLTRLKFNVAIALACDVLAATFAIASMREIGRASCRERVYACV